MGMFELQVLGMIWLQSFWIILQHIYNAGQVKADYRYCKVQYLMCMYTKYGS